MTKCKQKSIWKNASSSHVTSRLLHQRDEFLIRETSSRNNDHRCKATSVTKAKKRKNERHGSLRAFPTKLIIMAAAMWWCSNVDDCSWVEVSADKSMRCPIGCACYNEYKEIHCQGQNFLVFPHGIPNTAQELALIGNNISELDRATFKQLTRLKTLQLQNNRIRGIPVTAFYGLKNLRKLDLSRNKLRKIPRQAFGYVKSLQELYLRNNPITRIIAFDFILIHKALVTLDLGELRHLNHVSPEAFNGLTSLKTLKMDNCNMGAIPNLQSLKNLTELDLSANKVTVVRSRAFEKLYNLEKLWLNSCQINRVEVNGFANLYALRYLNLIWNNLTSLKASAFNNTTNLQALYLQHNPWVCNCSLMSLAGYLADNSLCSNDECPVCELPLKSKGVRVTRLLEDNTPPCAALIIDSPAQISLNVSVGDPAKLPCLTTNMDSDNNEIANVQWYLPDGKLLTHGRYKVRVKKLGNGSLNFTRVVLKDKGVYTCSVISSSNQVKNASVYLNVSDQPVMLSSSIFTTVTISSNMPAPKPTQSRRKTTTTTLKSTSSVRKNTPTTKKRVRKPSTWQTPNTQTSTKQNIPTLNSIARTNFPKKSAKSKPPQIQTVSPDSNSYQVLGTTNVIIGCFIGLTVIAGLLLIIFYKVRRKNFAGSRRNSNSSAGDKSNLSDAAQRLEPSPHATYKQPSDYDVIPTMQRPNGNKNAIKQSVTSTWVAALPEHMTQESVPLPSGAVRVLPAPTSENQRRRTNYSAPSYMKQSVSARCNTDMSRWQNTRKSNTWDVTRRATQLGFEQSTSRPKKQTIAQSNQPPGILNMTRQTRHASCLKNKGVHIQQNHPTLRPQDVKFNCANAPQEHPTSCVNITSLNATSPREDDDTSKERSLKNMEEHNGECSYSFKPVKAKKPVRIRSLEGLLNHKETEI